MALSTVGALLAAQRRSFWNRLLRESALGGRVATGVTFALVTLLLTLPGMFAFALGRQLGEGLRPGADPEALARWTGLQALFTVGFALLGSLRLQPVFDLSRLGHHPIPALSLLVAEIPAGIFEVFPLLGGAGIVLTHVGLAVEMPRWWPVVALLALQGLVAMLALLFLAAALRRWLLRRPRLVAILVLGAAATAAVAGGERLRAVLRSALRDGLPRLIDLLPGSSGCRSLLALRAGHPTEGLAGLAWALAATAAALGLAALAHRRERSKARDGAGPARREPPPLRFASPAAAVAGLHLRQLLASRSGRLSLALPLLLSGTFAGTFLLVRAAFAEGTGLPDDLVGFLPRVEAAPVLAWSLLAVVLLGSELWMNQFGWDRGGVRGLLQLPIAPEDLLRGKLFGQARFVALQALFAGPPLLLVYRATPAVALHALGAGAAAFVALTAAGQVFSLRFPRGIERRGASNLPLQLSWVPAVLAALVVGVLAGVAVIAGLIAPWAPPLALLGLAALAAAGYRAALPALVRELAAHRERLLRM